MSFNKVLSVLDVTMPGQQGSEDEVSTSSLQECTSTSQVQNHSVSARKRGKLWDLHPLLGQCHSIAFNVFYLVFSENGLLVALKKIMLMVISLNKSMSLNS